jgi:phage tail-like protein
MKRQFLWPLIIICSVSLVLLALSGNGRLYGHDSVAPDTVIDSNSYVFRLQFEGITVAEYTDCSGLGSSNDIVEQATSDASAGTLIQKTPGALRWHDITLRRTGVSGDNVWSWRRAMETGDAKQAFRDGAIVVGDANPPYEWVAQWTFRRGWAQSLILNGTTEELVIVHEGLERVESPSGGTTRR